MDGKLLSFGLSLRRPLPHSLMVVVFFFFLHLGCSCVNGEEQGMDVSYLLHHLAKCLI